LFEKCGDIEVFCSHNLSINCIDKAMVFLVKFYDHLMLILFADSWLVCSDVSCC